MFHLSQLLLLLSCVRSTTKSFGNVPEGDVHQLRLHDQIELVRLLLDSLDLVLSQVHQAVYVSLESEIALGAPLQPQLEDVVVPAALDDLVAGVVADVVELVSHEEILGRHLVTAQQQALKMRFNVLRLFR